MIEKLDRENINPAKAYPEKRTISNEEIVDKINEIIDKINKIEKQMKEMDRRIGIAMVI
mgnify:CR=1 FL=1